MFYLRELRKRFGRKGLINKKASDKSILWLNRIAVSCIAIIIVSLCTKNPEGIEEQFDTVKDYEL